MIAKGVAREESMNNKTKSAWPIESVLVVRFKQVMLYYFLKLES